MAIYTKTKGNVSLFTSKKCISILMRTSYHISKIMGKSHRDLPMLAGHHYFSDPWTPPPCAGIRPFHIFALRLSR